MILVIKKMLLEKNLIYLIKKWVKLVFNYQMKKYHENIFSTWKEVEFCSKTLQKRCIWKYYPSSVFYSSSIKKNMCMITFSSDLVWKFCTAEIKCRLGEQLLLNAAERKISFVCMDCVESRARYYFMVLLSQVPWYV